MDFKKIISEDSIGKESSVNVLLFLVEGFKKRGLVLSDDEIAVIKILSDRIEFDEIQSEAYSSMP